MTIKKRLFWSNIFMIAVPVTSTVLIGCVCVGLIWLSLIGGMGLGIQDQEDFDHACMAISEMLEYDIDRDAGFSFVKPLLDSNRMALKIVAEGETLFEYGTKEDGDAALLSAAESLGGQPTLTMEGRSLYVGEEQVKGVYYTIYLFGNYHGRETYSELKVSLVLSAIVIAFTIFLSILLTNRFLTKFVFRRIEEPLDILAGGVHEIRDGNLEYRITYGQEDEFWPICEDFNEMAVRLKQSVDRMQAQEKSRRELVAGISHDLRSPLTFLFSKMELGEYPENPQFLSLDEKISETVSALQEEYARRGLERGLNGNFDLILLDLMLPGIDGFAVCRKLREKINIPILMVTARQEDIDKIRGLGLGAGKPPAEIVLGGIRLNTGTHRVFVEEQEVKLKNKEYERLLFLMLNVDLVFDRETLYEKVWGLEAMGDNTTVAVHINRLREKLEKDPANPRYIETVWGAGYRFRG